MRLSARARLVRILGHAGLTAALLLPGGGLRSHAADPVVLRVGTVQDLDAMNPYLTEYYVGWEVFSLNYQGLVDFGLNAEPIGGFAKSWTQDGTPGRSRSTRTSSGRTAQPATSAGCAAGRIQTLLDAAEGRAGTSASATSTSTSPTPRSHSVTAPDAQTLVLTTDYPNTADPDLVPADPPEAHLGEARHQHRPEQRAGRRDRALPGRGVEDRRVRPVRPQPQLPGPDPEVVPGRDLHPVLQERSRDDRGAQVGRHRLRPQRDRRPVRRRSRARRTSWLVESTSAAEANAFTHMVFNTYSKPIDGGGASTSAVRDPTFRDALGYAIDKPALVDKVLGGHGLVGSTIIPPAMSGGFWHLEPTEPADLRHRPRQAEARAMPGTSSTRAASASTTSRSRSTSRWSCHRRRRPTARAPSSSQPGGRSSGSA